MLDDLFALLRKALIAYLISGSPRLSMFGDKIFRRHQSIAKVLLPNFFFYGADISMCIFMTVLYLYKQSCLNVTNISFLFLSKAERVYIVTIKLTMPKTILSRL